MEGSPVLETEVKYAIKITKSKKAYGPDELEIDILKLLEDDNIRFLTRFFNNIYKTGKIPRE